jgi:protein-tyrosine phosphatase
VSPVSDPTLAVRVARPDEEDRVLTLLTAAARRTVERGVPNPWPVPFPAERVRPHLERGDVYLAGEPGREPIATVTLLWEDPEFWGDRPPDAGYVHRLAVDPTRSGEGWGRRIVEWAVARVRARGRAWVRLDCVAANAGIRRYYRELGFAEVGEVAVRDFRCTLMERRVDDAPPRR